MATTPIKTIKATMKGVMIEKTGGVEVLEYRNDVPVPELKEGEVLIANEFIGVNYIDTYYRSGLYPSPTGYPLILGREASGTILATSDKGSLYDLKVGDKVVYTHQQSYGDFTAVPASKTHLVPSSISSEIAAASYLQGLTALTLIRESHHVQKGDWVLVHAAAGGVGLLLCQLLREVGARTIGTASTEEKLKLARENGAGWTVNYKEEKDFVGKIKEITGGEGVRVVFDSTGKDQFENDLEVLARKGTLCSFGNSSGAVPPFAISRLAAKNIKVLRPTLFAYIATREEAEHYTTELFNFIKNGKLNIKIHETYDLKDVQRAHSDLEGRKTTGKLLLKP